MSIICQMIMLLYVCCTLYCLVWTLLPNLRTIGSIMSRYRRTNNSKWAWDKESLLCEVVRKFGSTDLELLLDFLALSSGFISALRILARIDHDFQNLWKCQKVCDVTRLYIRNSSSRHILKSFAFAVVV